MDRYVVDSQIAEGVLASTFKVTDKIAEDNKHYVMKEVECLDVTSAKSALNEFRMYHSFNNKSICKIHDCFIKWNNEISSIFVCYVIDFFEEGTLSSYLNNNRSLQQIVTMDNMESWLGSLIDGMHLFHKNGIVHRNLKPSNLFMHTVDNSSQLCIGDFGPNIIMKDLRTSTRIKYGAMNYQAPEIMDAQDFDMKSDIWSIGAILLEICTTSLFDHNTFQMHLLNIRHDDELLKRILRDVHKIYNSTPLIKILKLMLNRNKHERITLKYILHDDFIQQCLALVGSDLVLSYAESPKKNVMLPKDKSVKTLVVFIESIKSEKTVEAALERLQSIIENQEFNITVDENQQCLENLMKNFPNSKKIQTHVLKLLEESLNSIINANMKLRSENSDEISMPYVNLSTKLMEKFFYLFLENDDSKESLVRFLHIIFLMSHFDAIVDVLADFKIIKYLLEITQKNSEDSALCSLLCKTIWSLAANENIMQSLSKYRSLSLIRSLLIKHQRDSKTVEMVCNVVIAVSLNRKVILEEETNTDLTSAILIVLENHLDSAKIVNSCCMSLAMMINLLEESALRFTYLQASEMNNEISGIDLLAEAYDRHKDKSEIVLSIINVFKELCNYVEMLVELKSLSLHERLIADIAQRFRDNIEISEVCVFVIGKIEERIRYEREQEQFAISNRGLWKKLQQKNNPAIF